MASKVEGKLVVVLDSTALRSRNGQLNIAPLEMLAKTAPAAGALIAIPSVVIAELKRAGIQELEEARVIIARVNRTLVRLGRTPVRTPELESVSSAQVVEELFSTRLNEWGILTLKLPDVPHAEILAKDIGRRKPFDDSGRGYRDALIWHSILEFAQQEETDGDAPEEVYFVTDNSSDFAGPDGELDSTLLAEAAEKVESRVHLIPTVHALIEQHIGPKLSPVREVVGKKVVDCFPSAGKALTNGLESLLDGQYSLREIAGPRMGEGEVVLRELVELDKIVWARKLSGGAVVIEFTASCDLFIAISIPPEPPKRKWKWRHQLANLALKARAVLNEKGEFVMGSYLPIEPSDFSFRPLSPRDKKTLAAHLDMSIQELARETMQ